MEQLVKYITGEHTMNKENWVKEYTARIADELYDPLKVLTMEKHK